VWNAEKYIERCIESVAIQDYDNYEMHIIDDCSDDNTFQLASTLINSYPVDLRNKFHLSKTSQRNGSAVANQITTIKALNLDDDDIIMLLDGDDSLANRNDIFTYYNELHEDADFVYGSSWSMVDNIPLVSQPYPPEIIESGDFRNYKFNWNMPYTHLRTYKAGLIKDTPITEFQDENGNWYKAGGDNSTFFNPLERCDPSRIFVNSDIVYNYNDTNPLNDYKVNGKEQNITASKILENKMKKFTPIPDRKTTQVTTNKLELNVMKAPPPDAPKKHILIAIPNKNNIEADTFKSIYDLEVPDGYETHFQFFYGYQVEQVRNLIADWVIKGPYDYLFAVDADIAFPKDTLKKLLAHNKDMVTGLYIQRIPGKHCIEVMKANDRGGVTHVPWDQLKGRGLVKVDSAGFGCCLIKKEVFTAIEYPHFVYKSALDHQHTISEDVYFFLKAKEKGKEIWADTSILCEHIGSWTFRVE
jgi:glycosyltransferase involved in cell wall biosynthesis